MSTIFNYKNLILENNDNLNIIQNSYIEENYFNSTLLFLSEGRQELVENSKNLYRNILESNEDYNVITESFADYFQTIKKYIDKFINYIKNLFARFITAINRFVQSEKYLIKHKKDFTEFGSSHEFEFDGYKFTFSDNIPTVNAKAAFDKDFIELDFDGITSEKDPSKVVAKLVEQHKKMLKELADDRYDVFRQECISADAPIDSNYYIEELTKAYRDGQTQTEEFTVDSTIVTTSLARLMNHKKYETSVNKTKDRIEKEYAAVKKSVENMISRNKDNDVAKLLGLEIKGNYDGYSSPMLVSSEFMAKLDLFLKDKVTEIMELSNIHAMAFSYKLDAIADCYKQDKQILYKALNKIQKSPNK